MLSTVRAVIKNGKKIEFMEPVNVPENTEVLVTLISENAHEFWLKASEESLKKIWDNTEDDIYGQLLEG